MTAMLQKGWKQAKLILPGFLVCVVIALIGQGIARFLPMVGAALFAILLGIAAGNTFLNKEVFNAGTKFSEKTLLEISIVLTGLTLNLGDIVAVGWQGVVFITGQMLLTIFIAFFIGRKLGFGRKFSLLMSAGNAVCGSSAIATVSPVVGADTKDKGISITIVNVTGTVLMVTLPLIAGAMYQHAVLPTSALIGGTLQSIGQVIASAKFVSDPVVEMATVFKIVRIIFLVLVALGFSRLNTSEEGKLFSRKSASASDGGEAGGKAGKKFSAGIPWFIIGFFLCSVIFTTGVVPPLLSAGAKTVSGQFEIIALAAIGMRVKFRDLVREGPKALLYGGLVGACQIVCALGLIALLFR
jgi:uncharacterized integral membrane protein (TIGR00698 family)